QGDGVRAQYVSGFRQRLTIDGAAERSDGAGCGQHGNQVHPSIRAARAIQLFMARSEKRLRIKTLIMVLATVVCAVTEDLRLKAGMSEGGAVAFTPSGLARGLFTMMTSGMIWLGIAFLLGFMASQMTVMSWADYSYVMPAGAFGYALQTLLAVVVLHEVVSAKRWVGVFLICIGVVLVGQTHPRTPACSYRVSEKSVASCRRCCCLSC